MTAALTIFLYLAALRFFQNGIGELLMAKKEKNEFLEYGYIGSSAVSLGLFLFAVILITQR
jgi:hypothetical protein